jgi:hypothetical protein
MGVFLPVISTLSAIIHWEYVYAKRDLKDSTALISMNAHPIATIVVIPHPV